MNFKAIGILVPVLIFMLACSAPKVLVSEKTRAESAAELGNYEQAAASWQKYFAQTPLESTSGEDFAQAAQIAFKSGALDLAVSWYDQARYKNYSDAEMYLTLAQIYQSQGNISKELSALEYISMNFDVKTARVDERLFELYNETNLVDKALDAWGRMSENARSKTPNLERYFEMQMTNHDTTAIDSAAKALLQNQPDHKEALEWIATKFYWLGENRYQREMKIYDKNKTRKQYRILVKELELSTADFKKSLGLFEKLWKMEPSDKYAGYMANIHTRFGEYDKAKYYQDFVK